MPKAVAISLFHTSHFVSFSPVHANMFLFANGYILCVFVYYLLPETIKHAFSIFETLLFHPSTLKRSVIFQKTLDEGPPPGNRKFCFPETLFNNEGNQSLLFPVGPVTKSVVHHRSPSMSSARAGVLADACTHVH